MNFAWGNILEQGLAHSTPFLALVWLKAAGFRGFCIATPLKFLFHTKFCYNSICIFGYLQLLVAICVCFDLRLRYLLSM